VSNMSQITGGWQGKPTAAWLAEEARGLKRKALAMSTNWRSLTDTDPNSNLSA